MKLQLYDVQDNVTVLGPGLRYVIWTQGCPRRCPGCMTPQSQPLEGGYEVEVFQLAETILRAGRTGLTISGGEPFLQAQALCALMEQLRRERDIGVVIYTGYTLAELQNSPDPWVKNLLGQCDLLVDGAYIEVLNDGKNGRGSANQNAIPLTNRYRAWAETVGTKPAQVEFFWKEEKISMVGVPTREVLERFQQTSF